MKKKLEDIKIKADRDTDGINYLYVDDQIIKDADYEVEVSLKELLDIVESEYGIKLYLESTVKKLNKKIKSLEETIKFLEMELETEDI